MTDVQSPKIPKYRRQRSTPVDRAFVELGGRRVYLGSHGSAESRAAYHRLLAEWTARGGALPVEPSELTVIELIDRFWTFATGYYPSEDGQTAKEATQYRLALRPLRDLYGRARATEIGPAALKAVRHRMIEREWTRMHINRSVRRIKRVFKWAVSEELLPVAVFQRLQTVEGLRRGHTQATESTGVAAVSDTNVEATLPHLTPTVRAMVQLQRLTGMRPGEVCIMRMRDLDLSSDVWVYTPSRHKTQHHGRARQIYIGPKGQAVLKPFLRSELDAYLFSPAQSERERLERRHAERVTPMSCGNGPGTNRVRRRRREPGDRYDTQSYGKAIAFGRRRAFPPPKKIKGADIQQWHREHRWSPNQLRHTFATSVRREHGLEAAQVLLGHAVCDVTQVYAERDTTKATAVAMAIG